MGKFIIGTFAILAWAFYVMSGGSNFVPETQLALADETQPDVTRARGIDIAITRPAPALSAANEQPAPIEAARIPAQQPLAVKAAYTAPANAGSTVAVIGIDDATTIAAPAPAAVASPDLLAIREVAARAVNMREGPDTSYAVIDTLPQGTQTEIIEADNTGWVRVRILNTGQIGWMAERLLTQG